MTIKILHCQTQMHPLRNGSVPRRKIYQYTPTLKTETFKIQRSGSTSIKFKLITDKVLDNICKNMTNVYHAKVTC